MDLKKLWPFRRSVPLSLFDARVQRPGETDDSIAPQLSPEMPIPGSHPKNALGGFYVCNQECIICGMPHSVAPDLTAWETDSESRPKHCYFKRQPKTEHELIQAIKALESSCCDALRYDGSDPEITKRLREAGLKHLVDEQRG